MPRWYDILNASRTFTETQIASAYRKRALATHPDKGGDAALFQEVVDAFEVLSNSQRREAYDITLQKRNSTDGLLSFTGIAVVDTEVACKDGGIAERRKKLQIKKIHKVYVSECSGEYHQEEPSSEELSEKFDASSRHP